MRFLVKLQIVARFSDIPLWFWGFWKGVNFKTDPYLLCINLIMIKYTRLSIIEKVFPQIIFFLAHLSFSRGRLNILIPSLIWCHCACSGSSSWKPIFFKAVQISSQKCSHTVLKYNMCLIIIVSYKCQNTAFFFFFYQNWLNPHCFSSSSWKKKRSQKIFIVYFSLLSARLTRML